MRLLFEMDKKNYTPDAPVFSRPSVRGIIVSNNLLGMVKSRKHEFYKFPGGGIEAGESHLETLCREVREETGWMVAAGSIRPYGLVHRIERGMKYADTLIQDNYYYLCSVETQTEQSLDPYEAELDFVPVWVDAQTVIKANRESAYREVEPTMLEREAKVTEMLLKEGLVR